MNQATPERLYNLLPALYRLRDAAQGEPLRALLALIADKLGLVEDDIARLYDNWFIETCDEWVVPYIGDLLGVRGLRPATTAAVGGDLQPAGFTQRAYVANTVAYRRRKGTAAVLEQLARDVTGWPAAAVEFFERLVTTQNLNHVRLYSPATPDLRDAYQLTFSGGAFELVAHTADVRRIEKSRGKYNIPNVGLFLWPIQAYHLDGVSARQVDANDALRYTFSPLGRDLRLYNLPQTAEAITDRAGPLDVPLALSRRFLEHNLDACYGTADDPKSLLITVGGQAIPSGEIRICDLSDKASGWAHTPPADKVALDPELGRIAFGSDPAGLVEVSVTYGFPGDLGGGPYDRRASLQAFLDDFALAEKPWQLGVMTTPPAGAGMQIVATLSEAVQAWNSQPDGTLGIIAVMDSRTYQEDLTGALALSIPAGSRLLLVAAEWPAEGDAPGIRVPGQIAPTGLRPHLHGAVEVAGTAIAGSIQPGALTINGLLIEGTVTVLPGNLAGMVLAHTTLVPGAGNFIVQTGAQAGEKNEQLAVTLERSIVADFTLPDAISLARVTESIVDGALAASALEIQSSTVLGATKAGSLEASNSIFVETVNVTRRQVGCVRFCYLPIDSQAPRRYRCQPATMADAERIFPHFTSVTFGKPAYGYLAAACPPEIGAGAEDEGEMGVFHFLQAPQRFKNLHTSLDEYLRFGLEAGVFFVF